MVARIGFWPVVPEPRLARGQGPALRPLASSGMGVSTLDAAGQRMITAGRVSVPSFTARQSAFPSCSATAPSALRLVLSF
jgi:hypothetical protein